MDELPEGWRIVTLAEVADTSLGKMLDRARPKGDVRVHYLRNVNVQWGRIDTGGVLTVELSDEECARFALESGDLLVCEGGEIGRSAIWTGGAGYMAYQKALHRVRSRGTVDLRWLRYLLEHYGNTGTLAARATGSTILHLPQQQLRQLPVPLPTLDEQHHIIEILEGHLSRLDAGERLVSEVTRRGEALLRSWLSEWLGNPRPHELFAVGERLSEARGGWSRGRQHEVATGGVPYLKMNNITRKGHLELTHVVQVTGPAHDAERFAVRLGDVLFNSKNSGDLVGKTSVATAAVEGWTFNENIMRLRFDDGVIPEFAAMWFQGPQLRQAIRSSVKASTNVAAIYLNQLRQMPMWVPSVSTQETLLASYDQAQVSNARLAEQLGMAQLKHSHLCRALLSSAFSGRLT